MLAGLTLLAALIVSVGYLAIDRKPAFALRRDPLLLSPQKPPEQPAVISRAVEPTDASAEPPVLPAAALQALAQDAAHRLLRGSRAQVEMGPGRIDFGLSIAAAATPARRVLPPGRWINVQARFVESDPRGMPRLQALKVGALPLPVTGGLPVLVLRLLVGNAAVEQLQLAAHTVEHLSLTAEGVSLKLKAPTGLAPDSRTPRLSKANLRRLHQHHEALVKTVARAQPLVSRGELPLSALLRDALIFAYQQAARESGSTRAAEGSVSPDALTQEYRLALLAVTMYAVQISPGLLAPELDWSPAPRHTVVLGGRKDHARHYLLSAALALGADRTLADALGLYKELADTNVRRGSGFSFDDMAADHAGAALGEKLMLQPQAIAALLPQIRDDSGLIPATQDLPSLLTAEQFLQRFGDVDSARFREQMQEIERRVQAVPLLAR